MEMRNKLVSNDQIGILGTIHPPRGDDDKKKKKKRNTTPMGSIVGQ